MIKKFFTKTNVLLFLGTAVSVLWLIPSFIPGGNDREIFRAIGRAIEDGFIPYRDFFDHKPPLIYFVFYGFELFGEWDIFISGTLFLLICIFLMKSLVPENLKLLNYLIPLFIIVWLRNPIYYEFGGLSREYSAYLYLGFFYVFLKNKRLELLALIAGLVLINQQNDVLPLLPLIFFKLFQSKKVSPVVWIKSLLFFLMPLSLIGIWLVLNDALIPFYEQAFMFNFKYYSRLGNIFHLQNFIQSVKFFIQHLNFGIIGLLTILIMNFSHKNKFYAIILSLTFFLGFINIAYTGRYYGHYFLPMGAILVFFIVSIVQQKPSIKIYPKILPIAIFSFMISIIWDNRNFDLTENRTLANREKKITEQIETIIKENDLKGKEIYIVNYSPGFKFYSRFNTKPVSKYFYFSPWDELPEWDKDLQEFNSIINKLIEENVLVFDFTNSKPFVRPEMNAILHKTLKRHYRKLEEITSEKQDISAFVYLKK